MTETFVIVVAGGSGSRFGGDVPKQFLPFLDKSVLACTLTGIQKALPKAAIILVISPQWRNLWDQQARQFQIPEPYAIAEAGTNRWESVRNGLALVPMGARFILVHDGARPNITPEVAQAVEGALRDGHYASAPALPLTDSLRMRRDDGSVGVDRKEYAAVQTPQGFQAEVLRSAYDLPYSDSFTDDLSVTDALGVEDVALVNGHHSNIKITQPHDLLVATVLSPRVEVHTLPGTPGMPADAV